MTLFQFLLGLNESYHGIHNNLLMAKPLPTINQVYNILVQEENQRIVTGFMPNPVEVSQVEISQSIGLYSSRSVASRKN